jgi:hypothetical protein
MGNFTQNWWRNHSECRHMKVEDIIKMILKIKFLSYELVWPS